MLSWKQLRENTESTASESQRKAVLNRGAKKEVHVKEDVVEHELTSVIEMLRNITEDKSGRIVIVEEGLDNKEVFVDHETADYILQVYETLDTDNQAKFEQTLIENVDSLDEIALYCETLTNKDDE